MANEENLIQNTDRSREEAEELSRKGGISSGEVRKEKKAFKDSISKVLEVLGNKVSKGIEDEEVKKLIKEEGYDVYKAVLLLNSQDASVTELVSLMKLLWGYKHGMPEQYIKQDTTIIERKKVGDLFPEDEELKEPDEDNKPKP